MPATTDNQFLASPIDLASLLQRCMNDPSFVCMLLGKVGPQFQQLMRQLDEAVAAKNFEQIARLAHSVKGTSANLSAEAVRACSEQLEVAAHDGSIGAMVAVVDELHGHVSRCLAYVPELIAQLQATSN